MACIRRVNLDMLWSVSRATVAFTVGNVRKGVRICGELGINPTYALLGPWPVKDEVGFTVALQMVKASLNPGKYQAYQQFDTIRGIRTAFSNIFEASLGAHVKREVLRGEKGIVLHPSKCPTQSLWFEKFARGLLSRMGREVRSNAGLSHLVLLEIIRGAEEELRSEETTEERKEFLLVCQFYFVVCFGASLQGCEDL